MNVNIRRRLIEEQTKLMQEYGEWEELQTECSDDEEAYHICQWEMQLLDEKAEQIRYMLETGCCL